MTGLLKMESIHDNNVYIIFFCSFVFYFFKCYIFFTTLMSLLNLTIVLRFSLKKMNVLLYKKTIGSELQIIQL